MSFKSMIQFFSYKMQRKYLTEVLSKRTKGLDNDDMNNTPYNLNIDKPVKDYQLSNAELEINAFLGS